MIWLTPSKALVAAIDLTVTKAESSGEMPVCLDICLMGERYEAGDGEDPRVPEWPSSFSARKRVEDMMRY